MLSIVSVVLCSVYTFLLLFINASSTRQIKTPNTGIRQQQKAGAVEVPITEPKEAKVVEVPITEPKEAKAVVVPITEPKEAKAVVVPIPKPKEAKAVVVPIPKPKEAKVVEVPITKPKEAKAVVVPIPKPQKVEVVVAPKLDSNKAKVVEVPNPKRPFLNIESENEEQFGLKWFGDGSLLKNQEDVEAKIKMYEEFMKQRFDAATHIQLLKEKIIEDKIEPIRTYRQLWHVPQKGYGLVYFTSQYVYNRTNVQTIKGDIDKQVQARREKCNNLRIIIETIAAIQEYPMYGRNQERELYRNILTCTQEQFREREVFYLRFNYTLLDRYINTYNDLYRTCLAQIKGSLELQKCLPIVYIRGAEEILAQGEIISKFETYKAFMDEMTRTKKIYITEYGIQSLHMDTGVDRQIVLGCRNK